MLEGMLSQTGLYNVAKRLGCTHMPTMSIFANIPPNSQSLIGHQPLVICLDVEDYSYIP